MADPSPDVRMAAIGALAGIEDVHLTELVRPQLADGNPRIAMTAAMVLAGSPLESDRAAAEEVLEQLAADPRDSAVETRRDLAAVLRQVPDPRFRRLLTPLLGDSNLEVAEEALNTLQAIGPSDFLFVPALVSLLRQPRLKGTARDLLVGYGEPVLDILGHFLRDTEEDITVRRHIPAAVARIPGPKAVELLCGALEEPDGYLRFQALAGLERIRRADPGVPMPRPPIEAMILRECDTVTRYAALFRECFGDRMPARGRLLARALSEKSERAADRIFRLLGLIHSWRDIASARHSFHAGGAMRARALEYLDNVLPVAVRKRVLPTLEQFRPMAVSSAAEPAPNENLLRTLLRDRDACIAAGAVLAARERQAAGLTAELEQLATAQDGQKCVTEAASWAIGSCDAIPAVKIAARLGSLPLFAGVSVDELFRIACAGRQLLHPAGGVIFAADSAPADLQFLVEGAVLRHAASGEVSRIDAPAPLDFEEVLTDARIPETISAATDSVSLALTFQELRSLMADSTGLLEGLLRMLCLHAQTAVAEPIVKPLARGLSGDMLDPINRATLLESYPVFSAISQSEMLQIAGVASVLRLGENDELFGLLDVPALYAVACGTVAVEGDGEPALQAGAGDAVGLYQMIAGIPLVSRAHCTSDSVIVRVDREDFLDLLMRRPDFLRQLLLALFAGSAAREAPPQVRSADAAGAGNP
jgi:CRP-like cAMP-binding protein